MSPRSVPGTVVLLVAVAALLAPSAALHTPGAPVHAATPSLPPAPDTQPTASAAPAAAASPRVADLLTELRNRDLPANVVHPPDLSAERPGRAGPVEPTYSQGPAPMGVADLGLRNASGTLVPYDYTTSGVQGTVTLNRSEAVYVDGDGPDTFGLQLNAVVTGVTLHGTPGFEFWTQDFLSYTSSTGQLTLGDNVWNFSSPTAGFPANVLASFGPDGVPVVPIFYYAVGPTFPVAYPFTVVLSMNATLAGGEPAVFFNYSISAVNGTWGGSFDEVVFASDPGPSAGPAPAPLFQVNGTGLGPSGLPNDIELDLVGNDDGDTTTFFAINGSMALRFWNATEAGYSIVPAAFDAGSDTGETSDGLLPVFHTPLLGGPPTVTLQTGPSFVLGLWNVSSALHGARAFTLTQRPQNAFLFVSPGASFAPSLAQWVPTIRVFGGTSSTFALPNTGSFTLEWMLSDRVPATYAVSGSVPLANTTTTLHETLAVNATYGSYTPLLAWGNAELAADSQAGNGSASNPYVLIHHALASLEPVFGQLNDFGFPVFAGDLLINTTDSVDVVQPAVAITYGAWQAGQLATLGVPSSNSLQLEFWNVTNVSVENSTGLTGWLVPSFAFYPAGAVLFWGSSGNLVAHNTFYDQGVALALYGGTNNTVWGNTILSAGTGQDLFYGYNTTGLLEAESGDLIYNNYIAVDQPALTPATDPYSCQVSCLPVEYTDRWNVAREPANASTTDLGFDLTGSILHTSYQGGNYWSNYGSPSDPYGVLPYNDGGRIGYGGDYVPLTLETLYSVTWAETGLPTGTTWNVTAFGTTASSRTHTVMTFAPNGTSTVSVGVAAGYALASAPTEVTLNGTNLTVPIAFNATYAVTVHETGLVSGWSWQVLAYVPAAEPVEVATASSVSANLTLDLPNGSYDLDANATGYSATPAAAAVTVAGQAASVSLLFTLVPILTVTASGLAPGTPWTVTVTDNSVTTSETAVGNGSLVFTILELAPGPFAWGVSAANYSAFPSRGTGTAPTSIVQGVTFHALALSSPGVDWAVVAVVALALLAALGFALYVLERRRGRRAPRPVLESAPAAVTPAAPDPAAPAGPPPWEEGPADEERPPAYTRRP